MDYLLLLFEGIKKLYVLSLQIMFFLLFSDEVLLAGCNFLLDKVDHFLSTLIVGLKAHLFNR